MRTQANILAVSSDMEEQTELISLSLDRFLSSATPRILMWSAKGISQPEVFTVARLE